ncbi:MAG: hypothetical protein IAF38_18170 [Bacteroidia bacterium]|nr:hypothetical protein [Bacteroidia bacterium]
MNLKGKVKSLTEIQYKTAIISGKVQKQYKGQWTKYSFNEKGFLIEKTDFEPNKRSHYHYDSLGKLISMKNYGRDSSLTSTHTFKYDSAGNQVEDNIENVNAADKGHNAKYIYKYDEKRNCIEMSGFNSKGIYFTKYSYKYNSAGNKIEEIWFKANGDTIHTYTYKYNGKGNKIEEHYKYTSNGGGKNKTIYKYDSKGSLIEENWGGTEGNVIEKVTYTPDNNFNWIKKITTENKEPSSITEREIEYFK